MVANITLYPRNLSFRIIKDNKVPNMGMVNLYTLTLPTPLYFSKIDHRVKAAAEMNPIYKSRNTPSIVKEIPPPPPAQPANMSNIDPKNN